MILNGFSANFADVPGALVTARKERVAHQDCGPVSHTGHEQPPLSVSVVPFGYFVGADVFVDVFW